MVTRSDGHSWAPGHCLEPQPSGRSPLPWPSGPSLWDRGSSSSRSGLGWPRQSLPQDWEWRRQTCWKLWDAWEVPAGRGPRGAPGADSCYHGFWPLCTLPSPQPHPSPLPTSQAALRHSSLGPKTPTTWTWCPRMASLQLAAPTFGLFLATLGLLHTEGPSKACHLQQSQPMDLLDVVGQLWGETMAQRRLKVGTPLQPGRRGSG